MRLMPIRQKPIASRVAMEHKTWPDLLGVNLLGDALRALTDPRMQR